MSANTLTEEEIHECYKLFDQEGSGRIKIKEIGTVMRSQGLVCSEELLKEIRAEAQKKDPDGVPFADFLNYVRKAQAVEADKAVDFTKEMQGVRNGMLHFFDKVSTKQIRESPPEYVKIADLKHLLSTIGEKMSEEEIEEMSKEMRTTCTCQDGRVKFEDFVNMLKSN
eukprot:gnl/TRDRNA2_/TRDRNA2_37132_c0_seq1.p1 gnl/TRDRNA2_/TRDRNA2_37132_c0~~gnl/TRDRNA2_/TRDRNA2_37132_c0_seq1.p1  ORF type:complete len:168 (-),score=57.98 gnl/TRDRNA2_/TRDRNA2_37132_c0_seq1:143-646(-)